MGRKGSLAYMPLEVMAGESHRCAKLTDAEVVKMRAEWDRRSSRTGVNTRKLRMKMAAKYGISFGHFCDIVARRKWRHV